MIDINDSARERLFGRNDLENMLLSHQGEDAVNHVIDQTKSTQKVSPETEDRLRKGVSLFTGLLEQNHVDPGKVLDNVPIVIGPKGTPTSYVPDQGVVLLPVDFDPEDVPHELEHFLEDSAYGLPGSNALRDRYYTQKTVPATGAFLDTSNSPISDVRVYDSLKNRPGISPYMAISKGFGLPHELQTQALSHLLYSMNRTDPKSVGLKSSLEQTLSGVRPLPEDVVSQFKSALDAAGDLTSSPPEYPTASSSSEMQYNLSTIGGLTTQTLQAMRNVAVQMEVLRMKLAMYQNLTSSHLKRLASPRQMDSSNIKRNYDALGVNRPAVFDTGDVDGLRSILKQPIDRTPNNSIMQSLTEAGYNNPRTVIMPEFD